MAEYLTQLHQPGEPGAVYLYGQPYAGTLLALQRAARAGQPLAGAKVLVYTSSNLLFTYTVTEILRHQTNLKSAFAAVSSQVWVQTVDDPYPNLTEIQLVAHQTSVTSASASDANPTVRQHKCP